MTTYDPAAIANGLSPATVPPPSPVAKALRAIDQNLDVLGEVATQQAAGLAELVQMGDTDAATLRRIETKLDEALEFLRDHSARVAELERWRGDHERAHVRQ